MKPELVLTEPQSHKTKPKHAGTYKAMRPDMPSRTPFNWAHYEGGNWGPLARAFDDAKFEWDLDEVRRRHGKSVEKRAYVWKGIVQ